MKIPACVVSLLIAASDTTVRYNVRTSDRLVSWWFEQRSVPARKVCLVYQTSLSDGIVHTSFCLSHSEHIPYCYRYGYNVREELKRYLDCSRPTYACKSKI